MVKRGTVIMVITGFDAIEAVAYGVIAVVLIGVPYLYFIKYKKKRMYKKYYQYYCNIIRG